MCFLAFTWFISFLGQPHIPGELEFPDHNADSQQQEGCYERIDAAAVSDLNYKLVVNFKNMKPARAAKKAKALSTNNVTIEKVAPTIKADDKDKDKKEKKAPAKKSK